MKWTYVYNEDVKLGSCRFSTVDKAPEVCLVSEHLVSQPWRISSHRQWAVCVSVRIGDVKLRIMHVSTRICLRCGRNYMSFLHSDVFSLECPDQERKGFWKENRNRSLQSSLGIWFLSVLAFRHLASSIQDRRLATLHRTLFMYLINKYISLSDICLTVHHWYK